MADTTSEKRMSQPTTTKNINHTVTMKANHSLNTSIENNTPGSSRPLRAVKRAGRCLAAVAAAALLLLAGAQPSRAVNPDDLGDFLKVSDLATRLLNAPMTEPQRQLAHARNFNQLPAAERALYLRAVACAVGHAVASGGDILPAGRLAEVVAESMHAVIPDDLSPEAEAAVAMANVVMAELNQKIANIIAGSANFQQAIQVGIATGAISSGPSNDC
jgi:hypothetical protein